jgi:hypothetical protein
MCHTCPALNLYSPNHTSISFTHVSFIRVAGIQEIHIEVTNILNIGPSDTLQLGLGGLETVAIHRQLILDRKL